MFDTLSYIHEQLASRGKIAASIECLSVSIKEGESYLEINAHNGIIFFTNPILLPDDTIISSEDNQIIVNVEIHGESSPEKIEEFSGQVIVELPAPADRLTLFQIFQVNYK